ncbi:MAG: hypothetical protein K2M43_00900 [Mycoplasmoidaceae bacterium]|nr:hypothetical protein [Mycoplasmoidaceae bacterium]
MSRPGKSADAFSNCGLCLPSYYLSQAKYDRDNHMFIPQEPFNINKAKLDLSNVSVSLNEEVAEEQGYSDFARNLLNEDYVSAF